MGQVFSWGRTEYGRLGQGDFGDTKENCKPTALPFFADPKVFALSVSAGYAHSAVAASKYMKPLCF